MSDKHLDWLREYGVDPDDLLVIGSNDGEEGEEAQDEGEPQVLREAFAQVEPEGDEQAEVAPHPEGSRHVVKQSPRSKSHNATFFAVPFHEYARGRFPNGWMLTDCGMSYEPDSNVGSAEVDCKQCLKAKNLPRNAAVEDDSEVGFPDIDDAVEVNKHALAEHGQTNHAIIGEDRLRGGLDRAEQHLNYTGDVLTAAAALAHGITAAHGFEDGNKRTAYHLTRAFLEDNGFGHVSPVDYDDEELADHLIGCTQKTHGIEDTAEMFHQRHHNRHQKQAAPIKYCPNCSSSHNTVLFKDRYCWNCGKSFEEQAGLDERPEEKTAHGDPVTHVHDPFDESDDMSNYDMGDADEVDHVLERHDPYQTHPLYTWETDFNAPDDELKRRHKELGPHEHLGAKKTCPQCGSITKENDLCKSCQIQEPLFTEGEQKGLRNLQGLDRRDGNPGDRWKYISHEIDGEYTNHIHQDIPVLESQRPVGDNWNKVQRHLVSDHGQYWGDSVGIGDIVGLHDMEHETGTPKHVHDALNPMTQYIKDEVVKPFVHPIKFIKDKHDVLLDDVEQKETELHFKALDRDEKFPGWRDNLPPGHPFKEAHETDEAHVHDPQPFKTPWKEGHVGDDMAAHHTNSDKLMEEHPYWSTCPDCGGDGVGIGATDVETGEQKQTPCKTCSGLGEAHDMEYWDSDEQMHDFANYPAFREQKIPDKGLRDHMKADHDYTEKDDDAYMAHQGLHGQIRVDPEIAGILFAEQKKEAGSTVPMMQDDYRMVEDYAGESPKLDRHMKKQLRQMKMEQTEDATEDFGMKDLSGDAPDEDDIMKTAVQRTKTWYLKQRDDLMDRVGGDKSTTVHDFGDGWKIKRLETTGDARYEGGMMKNCIKDAAKRGCPSCNPYGDDEYYGKGPEPGNCQACNGAGDVAKCAECGHTATLEPGSGKYECVSNFEHKVGEEKTDCENCGGNGACPECYGQGMTMHDNKEHLGYALVMKDEDHPWVDDDGNSRIHSLRDPDNIPQVSFVMRDKSDADQEDMYGEAREPGIALTDFYGRTNQPPKSEHGLKVSKFFKEYTKDKPGTHTVDVNQEAPSGEARSPHYNASPDEAIHLFGGHDDPATPWQERKGCGVCKEEHDSGYHNISPDAGCPECIQPRLFNVAHSTDDAHVHDEQFDMTYSPDEYNSLPCGHNDEELLNSPDPGKRGIKCLECGAISLPGKAASAGDTTDPTRVTQTPNFLPPTPRGKDPWKDLGDNGLPLHNPGLKHKLKRDFITDEQSSGLGEINYPGTGLMSEGGHKTAHEMMLPHKHDEEGKASFDEDYRYDPQVAFAIHQNHGPERNPICGVCDSLDYIQQQAPKTWDWWKKLKSQKEAVQRTRTWYINQRDALLKEHPDTSTIVGQAGDGWTVRKLNTAGDAQYEGKMMRNCIKDQAQKVCNTCDESGVCGKCGGDGGHMCEKCQYTGEQKCPRRFKDHSDCNSCDGTGHVECSTCSGEGTVDCGVCSGDGYCKTCGGDGHIKAPNETSLDDKSLDNNYRTRGKSNIYSLRDPENIPQTSFTISPSYRGTWGGDRKLVGIGIDDVWGRANTPPKPEHEARLVNFFDEYTKDKRGTHDYRGQEMEYAKHDKLHENMGVTDLKNCYHCMSDEMDEDKSSRCPNCNSENIDLRRSTEDRGVHKPYCYDCDKWFELGQKKTAQSWDTANFSQVLEEERDKLLSEQDKQWEKYPHLRGEYGGPAQPWDINNGLCEEFTNNVVNRVPEAQELTEIDCGDSKHNPLGDDGYPESIHAGHSWVYYKGKHYDAETLHGVDDPHNLPIFHPEGNPRLEKKTAQSWDTADSYSRNPNHDVPPSNRGLKQKYDPWKDKADTGELILPLAEGEDIKKWKTVQRPKPSTEQTTNQPQDKMKMEQVVGAATMKRCLDCGNSWRAGAFADTCKWCGGELETVEKTKKSAGWEWIGEFTAEEHPCNICGHDMGDNVDVCPVCLNMATDEDVQPDDHYASVKSAKDEDFTNWELETMKPSSEPFLMSPHKPEHESEPYFDANLGTRVFPDWEGDKLERHILQHHNGSIKDHGLIHFGHDEDADWTDNRAHYHESAFKPKGKLTQVGEDENGKPIYRMAMDLSGGGYDPVRDVSPSGKSAPAPSAQGQSGDPWPDLGDNGTAPPRPGFIFDPKLKKYIRDMQMTYPEFGPTFPGVTDINKINAGKEDVGGAYNWVRWTEDRDDGKYVVTAAACPRHKRTKAAELPEFDSIRTHGVKQCYFCGKSDIVNAIKVSSGPGIPPQQVGDHQADNGIDKPGGDKSKVKKWLPGAQEALPGNDRMNVSIDNQTKTGQAEQQTAEPEPAPKLTDLQRHLIEHPTHGFPPELLENPELMNDMELQQLHIEEHATGVFDHNPETLRVAKKHAE